MKHVGQIELQNISRTPEAFDWPVKRKSIFKRLLIALHVSRRRQARNVMRSYRHLLADDILDRPPSTILDFNNENESIQNAHADQASVRTNDRADGA
jgi:hypothetical protein